MKRETQGVIARWLRRFADRLDPKPAPQNMMFMMQPPTTAATATITYYEIK